jgi:integrase/recombinase XerD
MRKAQQNQFELLNQKHVNALTRQGKSKVTIESYARDVSRISKH